MTPPPKDPRARCVICKSPGTAARPFATFHGQGDNAMIVTFVVHDDCRPLLELRLPEQPQA